MTIFLILLLFSLVMAVVCLFLKRNQALALCVRTGAVGIILLSVGFVFQNFSHIITVDLRAYTWLPYLLLALEALMTGYIIYKSIQNRSYVIMGTAIVQFGLIVWYEWSDLRETAAKDTLYIDKVSLLMILIIGVIGGLICIYAVEYMKDYHRHHPECQDRRGFFFGTLFLFMAAMFGLVVMNDLTLLLFCWEVTSMCSFLLISYTKTPEANKNAFGALLVNLFGGLTFTVGIVLLGLFYRVSDLNGLLTLDGGVAMLAVFLITMAGLTKSAQLPFSDWLLGAMVAPTPSSAILHSSTMVKAGVYLIIRLAPMLGDNVVGYVLTLVGGFTFAYGAFMAVSQSDAKRILAYSTISNLGLIVTCASIDTAESVWAAIMLIVFHAISKSLLFLAVGSAEHQLGSRDVESMDGLFKISTAITMAMIVGIAGMFVAPFGMLISKWAAMKAFIDSGNLIIVLLVAFGSTVTMFFWTKWLGKLIANAHNRPHTGYVMRTDEKVSLYSLSGLVVIVCALHPLISSEIIIPYINSNMHIDFHSPIDPTATMLIIVMMCVLFILPLILIPLYRNYRVKPTSVYLSGENTGDNESFYGSMGRIQEVELRNRYMQGFFKPVKWCGVLCGAILLGGLLVLIGGAWR